MEGLKGIHALATFISILTVLWLTWNFTSSFLNFPTDTVQSYLFWGSFIMTGLITMVAVPYLIAMRDDTTASIGSAFGAWGVWGLMIILNLLFFPFFNAMINIFSDIEAGNASSILVSTFSNGTLITQIFSIFFVLVVLGTIYILPTIMALNPDILKDRIKKLWGAT